jgi:hypothetical protein
MVPHAESKSTEGGVFVKYGGKKLCSKADDKVRDA